VSSSSGITERTLDLDEPALQAALDLKSTRAQPLTLPDIEAATIDGAVLRMRPVLMTVLAVIGSLGPLLWETGISSDVMKPIAAPIVGGMISSTLAVMILVPFLFAVLKKRAFHRGTL
jgi:copper/silver efflux system protein